MNANRLMTLTVTSTNGTGIIMKAPRKATGRPMITQAATLRCQEQAENDEHQHRAQCHVLQHHVDAAFEVEGAVGPGRHPRLGRQGLVALLDERLDRGAHVDRILFLAGHHVDAEGPSAVEERVALDLGELVADGGHVAEPDARSVPAG